MMKKKLQLIHVDDDAGSLQLFRTLISAEAFIDYQGGFTDAESALHFLEHHQVDLIILDIEMPAKNGLWLAKQLKGRHLPIIFLTSHVDYALSAFELLALDYLLKPIDASLVTEMLSRYQAKTALRNFRMDESIDELTQLLDASQPSLQKLFINTTGETIIVPLNNLLYIKASGSYSQFVMDNKLQHTSSRNLKTYADALALHPTFIRIHRSYIVNKNYISSIVRKGRNSWVLMTNNDQLEIAERLKESIKEMIR